MKIICIGRVWKGQSGMVYSPEGLCPTLYAKGTGKTGGERPDCIGYSEIDKYAIQIYQKHFNHKNYGDATKINASELPDFDLLVGGFPCQAFSIAGKRGGFGDTRGTLFFDIARIAKAKKPLHMLLENVKGLVSHDGGKTLETILLALQELGYYVNIEVYNSKDFGVPQNRERIFFQCHNIRLLDGVSQTTSFSKNIIEQFLFQLLLNNLKEVQKLQETASKDWVAGYLLYQEINRSLRSSEENISDGISMATADGLFQLKEEDLWQSIATLLSNSLGEDLSVQNTSTISTAISKIIDSETYTYSQMLQAICLAIVLLRQSSNHLWNEVLSNLIVIKEDTKYARINDKTEEVLITEYGNAHKPDHFQDFSKHFSFGHLGRCCGRQVFPLGSDSEQAPVSGVHTGTLTARYPASQREGTYIEETRKRAGEIEQINQPKHSSQRVYDPSGIAPTITAGNLGGGKSPSKILQLKGGSQGERIYGTGGVSVTIASQAGGLGAKTGLYMVDDPSRKTGLVDKNIAPTLRTETHGNLPSVLKDARIRRLTPTECERLQGFPDGWTEGVSDTQRYKTLGNGVTVNVIEYLIKRLYESKTN